MQKLGASRYSTVAIPARLWKEISKIVEVSGAYTSEAEFVRNAIREKLQQFAISEVKELPEEELVELIVKYVKEHGRAYPSDIAADLSVPYFTVTSLISRLVEKGVLEPAIGESG